MARDDPHFRLRVPELLKQKLELAAKKSNRSVTAEVVSRLEQTFEHEGTWQDALATIDDMYSRLERLERKVQDHDENLYPTKYLDD